MQRYWISNEWVRPSFRASHCVLIKDSILACLTAVVSLKVTTNRTVDREAWIMSVEVKHPLDSASTDLLEVSRHRLEPLSTKMEERDADVMKVSRRWFFIGLPHPYNSIRNVKRCLEFWLCLGSLPILSSSRSGFALAVCLKCHLLVRDECGFFETVDRDLSSRQCELKCLVVQPLNLLVIPTKNCKNSSTNINQHFFLYVLFVRRLKR